jgi:hypothetical protein
MSVNNNRKGEDSDKGSWAWVPHLYPFYAARGGAAIPKGGFGI